MGATEMLNTPGKRRKKNHAANLRLIVQMLKRYTPQGGVTLEQMEKACGVSQRNIYRYLRELKDLGVEIDRNKPSQPEKSGSHLYRIKLQEEKEVSTEVLHLAYLNQALQDCYSFQNDILTVKKFILCSMATRYGFNLPVTYLTGR